MRKVRYDYEVTVHVHAPMRPYMRTYLPYVHIHKDVDSLLYPSVTCAG